MIATSSNNPQSVLVILRREYLNLTNDFCAAKLIEYFQHWRKWKLKNHRTEWIYMPIRQIIEDLMGEHSWNIVRRAIGILKDLRILEQRNNPGNYQDKTYQYKLNVDALERLMNSDHREIRIH